MVPQTIIKGFRKASDLAMDKLKDLAVDLKNKSESEKNEMLRKCGKGGFELFCACFISASVHTQEKELQFVKTFTFRANSTSQNENR